MMQPTKSTLTAMTASDSTQLVQMIYAGGTFGCLGRPLTPISADKFLPEVQQLLDSHQITNTNWLPNSLIKDSSQLSPTDFVHLYHQLLEAYSKGHRHFVLITGTDTLSYLGSFLAEAFAGSDICLVVTGSMRPLFHPDCLDDYQLDLQSDAWENLRAAIKLAGYGEAGVWVCFAGEAWPAQTVQKIHSHDFMAFTGHRRAAYPANSYHNRLSDARRLHWIEDRQHLQDQISQRSQNASVYPLYCLPNHPDVLTSQLEQLIGKPASGIILIGFGAGNVPYTKSIAQLLDKAYEQDHMVVSTSQCSFGGVGHDYAAGSWQYQHHVISGGRLTLAAIYARLLWLHLRFESQARRRQRWSYTINQADMLKSYAKLSNLASADY